MEEIKMKDSGIKWIGQIPEDWDVKKIKYQYKLQTGFTPDTSITDYYDDENGYIWVSIADIGNEKIIYDSKSKISDLYVNEKHPELVKKGSLLYSFKLSVGKVAFAGRDFYTNEAIASFKNSKNVCLDYLYYASFLIEENANINIYGAKILNQDLINNSITIVPPLQEQQRIAEFLDKKCADIDEIISKTEKQIETLEQYKKSLITETVTKGLKNSKLINSDIKWIGEIPFDWNTKKIKYVATLKGRIGWQGLTSDEYQDEGPYLITGVDFLDGQINWENCVHIPEKRWTEAVDIRIKENDLLITKDGTVGKVALVKNLKDKASLNSGVLLINLEEEYDKKYLFWVLQSDIFWKWFSYTNSGNSTIIHLYQHDFDNFEYPIPPMKEQKEIVAFLDMKCEKTDKIIKQQKESLETLKKYKQSLIYEYVTGKKRV